MNSHRARRGIEGEVLMTDKAHTLHPLSTVGSAS